MNFDAGLQLIEQNYRLMIIFAVNEDESKYSINSMNLYYKNAAKVSDLKDLIVDEEHYRHILSVPLLPQFKF